MKCVIVGRVHPERAEVWFLPQTWTIVDGGPLGGTSFTVSCNASQLTVVADVASSDVGPVVYHAEHIAQSIVSALGFATGTGYTVEIIQNVVPETGEVRTFGVRPGGLDFEDAAVFPAAAELAKVDVYFRLAIRDYVRAMTQIADCGHYCYRAVEAVKSSFPGGWVEMHAALGTTRDEIDTHIKSFADPVRHGNWASMKPISSVERNAMLQLTRSMLAAYMALRMAGPKVETNPK